MVPNFCHNKLLLTKPASATALMTYSPTRLLAAGALGLDDTSGIGAELMGAILGGLGGAGCAEALYRQRNVF